MSLSPENTANGRHPIHLRLHADAAWIPLAQGMAGQAGAVFGLDRGKILRLTMAAEEILAYLAAQAPDEILEITCTPGASHVALEFAFTAADADLWAMNITAGGVSDTEDDMRAMGLMLAARMSDGFEIRREGGRVVLGLRMNRPYPEIKRGPITPVPMRGTPVAKPAEDPARISEACRLALSLYPTGLVPAEFATPGMIVDQIRAGDLGAALAEDDGGSVRGFLIWKQTSAASATFCGPYVFAPDAGQSARVLTDHLVNHVARTAVTGLLSELATSDLPREDFELLGELPLLDADGRRAPLPLWYRGLREDNGLTILAHRDLEPFLEDAYARLFLVRDIRPAQDQGAGLGPHSVLAARLRPAASQALLTPMLAGADIGTNLKRHVDLLLGEGYRNILLHLDLSVGWQAALPPILAGAGFQPVVVLPFAGRADVVVFQHARA
ncbi:MAG: hypothetical protein EOL86_04670 [Deltaproteobacteria bacterium]|nr:hypothetical protein [Deltaproteobacteria bacterium]